MEIPHRNMELRSGPRDKAKSLGHREVGRKTMQKDLAGNTAKDNIKLKQILVKKKAFQV